MYESKWKPSCHILPVAVNRGLENSAKPTKPVTLRGIAAGDAAEVWRGLIEAVMGKSVQRP
jgi:hypothetical protein